MPRIQTLYAYNNILGGEESESPYPNLNYTSTDGTLETSPILRATNLQILDISTNYYYGTIPVSLTNIAGIKELYLEYLELEGTIPPELFSLSRIEKLYLGMNYLESVLPPQVGNARSLGENNFINFLFVSQRLISGLSVASLLCTCSITSSPTQLQRK